MTVDQVAEAGIEEETEAAWRDACEREAKKLQREVAGDELTFDDISEEVQGMTEQQLDRRVEEVRLERFGRLINARQEPEISPELRRTLADRELFDKVSEDLARRRRELDLADKQLLQDEYAIHRLGENDWNPPVQTWREWSEAEAQQLQRESIARFKADDERRRQRDADETERRRADLDRQGCIPADVADRTLAMFR